MQHLLQNAVPSPRGQIAYFLPPIENKIIDIFSPHLQWKEPDGTWGTLHWVSCWGPLLDALYCTRTCTCSASVLTPSPVLLKICPHSSPGVAHSTEIRMGVNKVWLNVYTVGTIRLCINLIKYASDSHGILKYTLKNCNWFIVYSVQ